MRTYKVRINRAKNTITIKVYENGKLSRTFRGELVPKAEIEEAECWTEADIKDYLRTL